MTGTEPWLYPLGTVLLAGIGGVLLVRGLFGRWFRAGGKAGRVRSCRKCRFDLSATEGHTCPECGHTSRHEAQHYAGRFRWPVAALGLVLLVGAVGVGMTPGIQRDGWLHLLPMAVQVRVFHLEKNDTATWGFLERLNGRTSRFPDRANGMRIFVRQSSEPVPVHVEAWRATSVSTAVHIITRQPARPEVQMQRAGNVLSSFADHITAEDLTRLLRILRFDHQHVIPIVAKWEGEPTPEIRSARRDVFASHPQWASSIVRTIVRSTLEPEDEQILGTYLAISRGTSPASEQYSHAQFLHAVPTPGVWAAYAEEVRAGRIGNLATLIDGGRNSERVTAAAIEHVASLGDGAEHDRLVKALFPADLLAAGPNSGLDRARLRGLLTEPSDFKARQGLVRLLNRYDTENPSWYIELARDPGHPLRDQAMHELRLVSHDRERVARFCLDEAWHDNRIGLYHRMWPLFGVQGWREAKEYDITARWSEVLELAAAGDQEAIEDGLPRFASRTLLVADAMLAVARRLVEVQPREPWLEDLAFLIAECGGEDPTVHGFAQAFQEQIKRGFSTRHADYREAQGLIALLSRTDPPMADPESQTEPP